MTSQPEKILLVTERPLLALDFRELIEGAAWEVGHVVLRPEGVAAQLDPDTAGLVVIDSEAEIPWETIRGMCTRMPRSRFVVWCAQATPQVVQAAMEAGLHGLLSLRLPVSDAAQALVQIWNGERQFRFDGELQPRVSEQPVLTPREQQVIALVMEGRRNREIAEALQTTEGSVKVHINRLFWKTGAKNRQDLAQAGKSFLRRTTIRPARRAASPRLVDPFDAGWMFTGTPSDFRTSGEASYDSIER
ncbi:MAG TPA: response regulator transcription factor [Bryobacteraceae bacterium]|jgi:DNA-binding NarL/FixJ family response regulator